MKEAFSLVSQVMKRKAVFFAINYKFDGDDASFCKDHGTLAYFNGIGASPEDGGLLGKHADPKVFFDFVTAKFFPEDSS